LLVFPVPPDGDVLVGGEVRFAARCALALPSRQRRSGDAYFLWVCGAPSPADGELLPGGPGINAGKTSKLSATAREQC
jgi:hypothetical protein